MAAVRESAAAVTAASASSGYLQKFRLYETHMKFYLVGSNNNKTQWRVLIIDRLEPSELNIHEDPTTYSTIECNDLLKQVHEGNTATGGLKFVTKCYGLAGFVKFLGPYYMLLITRRRKIGNICGHAVYGVSKSEMIIIPNSTVRSAVARSKDENRYKKLLCSVDLTKDFFFSYSYNIMRSLQKNLYDGITGQVLYETMFVWNEFLTRGVRYLLKNTTWTVALIHGYFKQIRERLRSGLSNNGGQTCPSGLHNDGSCSCTLLVTDVSSTRASITRIFVLAEALFEVLDEIHRQHGSLPHSFASATAPESVVSSLPTKIHKKVETALSIDNVEQCYICLADYENGDAIRILPCHHEYHMICVDKWLKEIHRVCPLCRRDVSEGVSPSSVPNQ